MKNATAIKSAGFLLGAFLSLTTEAQTVKDSTTILFDIDTVAKALSFPWEILHGPDDSLWITEARGYRVVRISSNRTEADKNVAPQQILKVPLGSSEVSFNRSIGTWPQGGMQGMVLHPEFESGKPWVYLSYVYSGTCPGGPSSPCYFRSKIVRCKFYYAGDAGNPSVRIPKQDSLVILDTLINNLPGSNDHNSGRLAISPVKEGPDNTYKLYYTIGDMGAGQFNNGSRTNNAQNRDTCEGKILRLNTEPDGDGTPSTPIHDYDKWRRWIPNDNPFTHSTITGLRTPVYSYGHRNAQGLVWGEVGGTWRLYSSEHGDKSDDETNVIEAGGNYGWPKVAGMADNNYSSTDAYANNDVLAGQNVTWSESTWATTNNMQRPLFSFFNAAASAVPSSGANIFTWPTIAPSSIDFYEGNIPGWKNSLLVTSLKYGLYRLKLNSSGTFVDSTCSSNVVDTFPLLHSWRVRDIALNPIANSGEFWVVIDSTGSTSGPTGGFSGASISTKDGGAVLRLKYKTAITLPVNFVRFSGRPLNDEVLLNWEVVESDRAWFDIEKSTDGRSFSNIGKVINGEMKFTDKLPSIGNNYYRIKAVEASGKATYTAIINVLYQPAGFVLRIFPNPVGDVLHLQLNAVQSGNVVLAISDVAGRIVESKPMALRNGVQSITVNTTALASQAYLLKVVNADGRLTAKQWFVK